MEDLHLVAARELLRTMPAIMREITSVLRRKKYSLMPAHLGVLAALSVQSYNLSELAEQSAVSLPTMSSTISHMVRQGWVQRTRSPHDRRVVQLELTPNGRELCQEYIDSISDFLSTHLQHLSPDQLAQVHQGLQILQTIFVPYHVGPTPT